MKRLALPFLAILLVFGSVPVARADQISWLYSGTASGFGTPSGSPATLLLTIDTNATGLPVIADVTEYHLPQIEATIAGYTWVGGWNKVGVNGIDFPVCCYGGGVSYLGMVSESPTGWVAPADFPFVPKYIWAVFRNPSLTTEQPLTPPAPEDLVFFEIGAIRGGNAYPVITGTFSSVEVVPEPASLLLLGTGLVGLVRMRKRRQ